MNKKFYFIGSEDLKNNLERSLLLIGWKVEDFVGWNVDSPIIYQLEKVDSLSFHIPDNLLIVTNNDKLKNYNNSNIFYYQMNNLKFTFSKFVINYFHRQYSKPSDFYENKESVNLLYNQKTRELDNLVEYINKKNRHTIKKFKYSEHLSEQPLKTIVYFESPQKPFVIKKNFLTIYNGYSTKQKKELRSLNPSVPKLFINKISDSTINKILKHLN